MMMMIEPRKQFSNTRIEDDAGDDIFERYVRKPDVG